MLRGLFSPASLATELEFALGLLIVGWMLAGLRLAGRGRREPQARHMGRLPWPMGAFPAIFIDSTLDRDGVEAPGAGAAGPAFTALLILHVACSLAGGVWLIRLMLQGRRAAGGGKPAKRQGARAAQQRWGGLVAGFWPANGLPDALVFLVAQVP